VDRLPSPSLALPLPLFPSQHIYPDENQIQLRALTVRTPANVTLVQNLNMTIAQHAHTVIVGPSGSVHGTRGGQSPRSSPSPSRFGLCALLERRFAQIGQVSFCRVCWQGGTENKSEAAT